MAYQTSSGTFDQMVAALSAFAIANTDMTAPASPGTKNWWRIVLGTSETVGNNLKVDRLVFTDSSDVSLGAPNTTITNAEAGNLASNVWAGSGWETGNGSVERPFVGGNWTTAIEVEKIQITLDGESNHPIDFVLEWSNDGSTWQALSVFSFGNNWGSGDAITFTVGQAEALNVTPGDGIVFGLTNIGIQTGVSQWATNRELPGGGSDTFYPIQVHAPWGRSNFASIRDDPEKTLTVPIASNNSVTQWHFFSDSTVSDHVHCAYSMAERGVTYWHHISFGLIDNTGLTHHGVAYMVIDGMINFVNDVTAQSLWLNRSLLNTNPFLPYTDFGIDSGRNNSQWLFVNSGGSGFPVADNGSWPARNIVHDSVGFGLVGQAYGNFRDDEGQAQFNVVGTTGNGAVWDSCAFVATPNPVSGFTSLGVIPVIARTSVASQGELCVFLGQMPNFRHVRIDTLSAGDDITVGSDTWTVFPRKRKTSLDELDNSYTIGSGPGGWAYKKVT